MGRKRLPDLPEHAIQQGFFLAHDDRRIAFVQRNPRRLVGLDTPLFLRRVHGDAEIRFLLPEQNRIGQSIGVFGEDGAFPVDLTADSACGVEGAGDAQHRKLARA